MNAKRKKNSANNSQASTLKKNKAFGYNKVQCYVKRKKHIKKTI